MALQHLPEQFQGNTRRHLIGQPQAHLNLVIANLRTRIIDQIFPVHHRIGDHHRAAELIIKQICTAPGNVFHTAQPTRHLNPVAHSKLAFHLQGQSRRQIAHLTGGSGPEHKRQATQNRR